MQPSDMIEWTYKRNGRRVINREQLWSTLMKQWVPIGSGPIHTLISIDGERITWMNEEGCFCACMDDFEPTAAALTYGQVVPRKRIGQ